MPGGSTTPRPETQSDSGTRSVREGLIDLRNGIRRAFAEFLTVPTLMVAGFLLLALALYALDRGKLDSLDPVRGFLTKYVFIDAETTSDLLAAIAAGIITVASITISLLLLAVQQGAGSMTSAVFDQFMRRRLNQIYFGFFIGLALYSLVTLATVHESSNAVLGATVGFVLTIVALFLLIVLLYSTINQMRPAVIIAAIHDHTLRARRRQLPLITRTRRVAALAGGPVTTVKSAQTGFVVRIETDKLTQAQSGWDPGTEIQLRVSVGSFVAFRDTVADIRGRSETSRESLAESVPRAIVLERQRDIAHDPAYGIGQLGRIGWSSISSAKSSPGPGLHVIRSLRDLMSRWAEESVADGPVDTLPVVYDDTVHPEVLDAFESLAVASAESMQHQCLAEIVRAIAITLGRLPPDHRAATVALAARILPSISQHVLTADLVTSLRDLKTALAECGYDHVAARIDGLRDKLDRRVQEVELRGSDVDVHVHGHRANA